MPLRRYRTPGLMAVGTHALGLMTHIGRLTCNCTSRRQRRCALRYLRTDALISLLLEAAAWSWKQHRDDDASQRQSSAIVLFPA